ncbi:MAG TPA: TetR/AcrR family transcriptional regulator [Conexibacter sp.]|jgi:AcrR family transcriptional regulator|nr:TetR/AcrR family transcriptional regulator [Conexibacter sp.]
MAVTTPTGSHPPSSAASARPLESDKAKRIVDAMRESVAARGAAGSTFDHVAREAGVSRGLLHYYFGTKERLLVEVVRRDAEIRLAALGAALGDARTGDDFIDALVRSLEDLIERDPGFVVLMYELFTLSRRNDEIAGELSALCRQTRETLAVSLAAKQEEGVVRLGGDAEAVAGVLLALGDGLSLRFLTEPDVDPGPTLAAAVAAARALIADAA